MKLSCEHIVKTYGDRDVLQDVSLTLEQGKIYGLIGRNGAGKTTLLSVLTAQSPATSGTVTLDNQPVWENRAALEKLCFSRELNPSAESGLASMKVKEYLRIASIFYPNWDRAMEKRLLELFDLPVKRKLSKLSKGMLSMVTILVAMCSKAPFTLLDEPVAGLDVIAREQFYQLVLEDYAATGRTFVISTHIIEEAANILEEVIILHEGKILRKADTQSLVDSACLVSGRAEDVDAVTEGLECHHPVLTGRSKSVTVLLKPDEALHEGYDVSAQPVTLQGLFVALCGEEA